MAIPYLGSKRKTAGRIYNAIQQRHPDHNILVDLFCGGFAVGEHFYKQGWEVIANDLNKYVVALLDQTINKGLDEQKCLEFVTREKFFDVLNNPDNYKPWYVGYVMCVWSFGNQQTTYMFGKDTEPYKLGGHNLVVYKDPTLLQELIPQIPQKYIDSLLKLDDWHKRRIALGRIAKTLKTRILELQQLEQLERLQQLQQLERLQLYSLSYDKVTIPKNAIIYCDPPYKNTAEYSKNNFDHDQFWQWAKQQSKTHPIYVSEYQAPPEWTILLEWKQSSTLQGGQQKHDKQPTEKLFTLR